MAESVYYTSRFIDLMMRPASHSDGSSGDDLSRVFGYQCTDCGPAADTDVMRLIDIVRNPAPDEDHPEPWLPVYAQVATCGKDWKDAYGLIDYDFKGHPTYRRFISSELRVRWEGGTGCFNFHEEQVCIYGDLRYDVGLNEWNNQHNPINAIGGGVIFHIWGETDGVNEFWVYTVSGCQDIAVPTLFDLTCFQPLRGAAPIALQYDPPACCIAPNGGLLYFQSLVNPVYIARLVDVVDYGAVSGSSESISGGQNVPVYLAAECCPDVCDPTTGCCDHLNNGFTTLDYIPFDLEASCAGGGGCVLSSVSFPPLLPWQGNILIICSSGEPNTQSGVQVAILECVPGNPRGWENFQLRYTGSELGEIIVRPVDGSCDPFFLLFEDLPFQITLPDSTVCTGTFDLTITLPP